VLARPDLLDRTRARHLAGEQLVENDTARVHVALLVGLLTLELLGRHVVGRTGGLGGPRLHGDAVGDAEITDLHELDLATVVVEAFHEHEVLGLDVAVDDLPSMRMRQPRTDLDHVRRDALERQRLAGGEDVAHARAVEVLHGEVEEPVLLLPEVEDAREVRVVEPARGECLGVEPRDEVGVVLVRVAEDLHGDVHVEIAMARAIHGPGSALPYPCLDEQLAACDLATDERVDSGARQGETERIPRGRERTDRPRQQEQRLGVTLRADLEDVEILFVRR